jgi:hypothetical protein
LTVPEFPQATEERKDITVDYTVQPVLQEGTSSVNSHKSVFDETQEKDNPKGGLWHILKGFLGKKNDDQGLDSSAAALVEEKLKQSRGTEETQIE